MNPRDADNLAVLRRSIPESDVQSAIIDYLVLRGACVIRVNGGTMPTPDGERRFVANTWYAPGHRRETKGTADIIAMWNGECFAIEVKRVGGKQSPDQRAFQAAWEDAGGWYILASSVDDVIRELGGIMKNTLDLRLSGNPHNTLRGLAMAVDGMPPGEYRRGFEAALSAVGVSLGMEPKRNEEPEPLKPARVFDGTEEVPWAIAAFARMGG